jgi:putative ABC transport system ATP-binding protein
VVVGKSGSGKSVVLRLVAGLDRPTAGSISVGETRLEDLTPAALTRWRQRTVGILLQDQQLIAGLNVLQNVQLALELADVIRPKDRVDHARESLAQVGMLNYESARPAKLSVG